MNLKILRPADRKVKTTDLLSFLQPRGQGHNLTLLPRGGDSVLFIRDEGSDRDKINRRFHPDMELGENAFFTGMRVAEAETALKAMFPGIKVETE